jgi:hypothetical protein
MTVTAAVMHPPRALTAHDFGERLAHRGSDLGRGVRRMYRSGQLPPPIDASLPAVQWRWSPKVVDDYINPQAAA